MLSHKNNLGNWKETESQVSYHLDLIRLTSVAEWRALSGVALPGATESCESKGEPEVDQTHCYPTALM